RDMAHSTVARRCSGAPIKGARPLQPCLGAWPGPGSETGPVKLRSVVPEKRYLFTPGPTPVPPEVLEVLSRPAIHHRGPDVLKAYASVLERLKEVYRTENDVLLFTASGTGAFESAVANLTEPGERALVVASGNFGERRATMV